MSLLSNKTIWLGYLPNHLLITFDPNVSTGDRPIKSNFLGLVKIFSSFYLWLVLSADRAES